MYHSNVPDQQIIISSVFPSTLKRAEITLTYKEGILVRVIILVRGNYRPVSVLACL